MELGPQNHNEDGLLGPNSIIVVYMDPLGNNLIESHYSPSRVFGSARSSWGASAFGT